MRRFLYMVVAALVFLPSAKAQVGNSKLGLFNHLDAAISTGSTGVGVDVTAPVGDYLALRAGFDFMPHFEMKMKFDIQMGDRKESKYDAAGNRVETKLDRMSKMMHDITGYQVDDQVDMIGEPSFYNFKLLVDVFPMKKNKHWHITAGCYWGPSTIARTYNTTEDMPSLLAVGLYNNIYDKVKAGEPITNYRGTEISISNETFTNALLSSGRMGIHVGDWKHNVVQTADERYSPSWMPDDAIPEGAIVYRKGTPYMMEPDENGMVKATMKVNRFRPYLGFGYGGRLLKNDNRYQIGFDCGVMFWGGSPSIVTHDGTDLMNDVENIGGKVGDYVDLARKFKVYPVVSLRIARSLF